MPDGVGREHVEARDRGLDRPVDGDPRGAERAGRGRVPVHRVHDERPSRLVRGARELARDRELPLAQLVGERAVAAEVRREEHGVEALGLEQGAGRADEAEGVLLARAGEVDRVRGRRGRRQRGSAGPTGSRSESTGRSRSCSPSRSLATAP